METVFDTLSPTFYQVKKSLSPTFSAIRCIQTLHYAGMSELLLRIITINCQAHLKSF